MSVDAFYKSAGVKMRSSIYSSGAVQADLTIKGMHLIRLTWSLPSRNMEVFSVMTDILLIGTSGPETYERTIGVGAVGPPDGQTGRSQLAPSPKNIVSNTTCSWSALDRLIGLKLCTDYQFPSINKDPNATYFILTGPTLFKVSLIKADPTATNYVLEYSWNRTEVNI